MVLLGLGWARYLKRFLTSDLLLLTINMVINTQFTATKIYGKMYSIHTCNYCDAMTYPLPPIPISIIHKGGFFATYNVSRVIFLSMKILVLLVYCTTCDNLQNPAIIH